MTKGDFFDSEQSAVIPEATHVRIEHVDASGNVTVLKNDSPIEAGEVLDASFMSVKCLTEYYEREMEEAKKDDIMLSLHLKATMMKVSDPIFFGHAVKVFFKDAFAKHGDLLKSIGANPNNGVGSVLDTIASKLDDVKAAEVKGDFDKCYETRPWLAMVDSRNGITNLHVPSDVIIDASMPCVVRDSGQMWNKDDALEDTKCLIPDRSYSTMYQEMLDYCRENGQFDVSTMGNVSNVGLMAKKAEEYGSHPNTFEVASAGTMRVVDANTGKSVFEHTVETGDVWRMCQTKDEPIRDWVRLAVSRAKATGDKTVFWLDEARAHDRSIISLANKYLKDHDLAGCDISIMKPVDAMRVSCERATAGKNTISVTGNVLRDYLTDLFPILELGTSAKMLSIVPLLAGGALLETGAGGSAPKHVQQFVKEGHLRWDSLGEYLATAVGFETLGTTAGSDQARILGECLTKATGRVLDNRKSPSRKVNEIDNRATNFYIALYWAEYMSEYDASYKPLYEELKANREKIVAEHTETGVQGKEMDVGGYFKFDFDKASKAMRPSPTMNKIIDN
jgi:isocitrate dehydrogenase